MKKRIFPVCAGIILCAIYLLTLSVGIYAAEDALIYPAVDVWNFSTVSGSGRGREQSGSYRRFSLSEKTLTTGQTSFNAPAVLTVSPATSTIYKRFSGSWATTQSVYQYDRVELTLTFAPGPEYAAHSTFSFVVHVDAFAFGSQTEWYIDSLAGISQEGFPLVGTVENLHNNYYLISIQTKSIQSLSFVFIHSGTEFSSGYNVGSFSLSFSSAWVDTVPTPPETVIAETFPHSEITLPAIETTDISSLEQYMHIDFPAVNLAAYYSAFAWWTAVIDNAYISVPIFSVSLTVGIAIGCIALVGGLYKAEWRGIKREHDEKIAEDKRKQREFEREKKWKERHKK